MLLAVLEPTAGRRRSDSPTRLKRRNVYAAPMRRAVLIATLIFAACGSDSEATTTPPPPPLTSLPAEAPPTTIAAVTEAPTTIAPTTTTTTTLPPNAAAEFGLTQIVFGDSSFVVITNWGNDTGTLDGYWICQFPSYKSLPDIELAPGEQALLGLARTPPPDLAGMAAVVDLGPVIGEFDPISGEVGLYTDSSFDDPESIVAYVEWGEAGHTRAPVAIAAGIWSDEAVEVFDDAPSISSGVFPVLSHLDWSADVGG